MGLGRRAVAVIALVTLLLGAAGLARADVIHLEGGGKVRGEIVEESEKQLIIRTPFGSTHVISREDIARIERTGNPREEFANRFDKISAQDASGYHELGLWASRKGLEEEAARAYQAAIAADPDHEKARRALGHRRHNGVWYDEVGYKKAVEGLVQWEGQWVTPTERKMLEAGFRKNAKGEWVRPEDLWRQGDKGGSSGKPAPREETTGGASGGRSSEPTTTVSRERPSTDGDDTGEAGDTSWYDDHETVMTWDEALKRPYKSRYYKIFTNIKPEYAKRYAKMLDTYSEKGYQRVFNARKNLPNGFPKGLIYIYPDHATFKSQEGVGDGVGGYYQPGQSRVVCYHGRFGKTGTTKTVLVHEATHQFEDYVLPGKMWNAPIWIIEGFAVFFESASYDHEAEKVVIGHIPRDRLENLKTGIQRNEYIRLPELIRTPQYAFSGYHYAHAWSLIYYMVYGGSEKKRVGASCHHAPRCKNQRMHNQEIFSDLFFLARTKQVTPEDTEMLFGGRDAFAQFEQQWKQWILDVPYDFDPLTDDFDDIQKRASQPRD